MVIDTVDSQEPEFEIECDFEQKGAALLGPCQL